MQVRGESNFATFRMCVCVLIITGSSEHSTYVVQTLDFHLGHNTMVTKPCGALESPMATITKITRRRHENPPHGVASVKEWFNYVTATRNEGKISCSFIHIHNFCSDCQSLQGCV